MKKSNGLYHFCADWMLEDIKRQGLTEGKLVINMNPIRFMSNYQWLTLNPDFNQSWNEHSSLPYDRTANRLKVEIPDRPARYLYAWLANGEKMAGKEMFETLSAYGDPENWFVFRGQVKPEWIKEIRKKPIISKLF